MASQYDHMSGSEMDVKDHPERNMPAPDIRDVTVDMPLEGRSLIYVDPDKMMFSKHRYDSEMSTSRNKNR